VLPRYRQRLAQRELHRRKPTGLSGEKILTAHLFGNPGLFEQGTGWWT
jgi:hypothetical protein